MPPKRSRNLERGQCPLGGNRGSPGNSWSFRLPFGNGSWPEMKLAVTVVTAGLFGVPEGLCYCLVHTSCVPIARFRARESTLTMRHFPSSRPHRQGTRKKQVQLQAAWRLAPPQDLALPGAGSPARAPGTEPQGTWLTYLSASPSFLSLSNRTQYIHKSFCILLDCSLKLTDNEGSRTLAWLGGCQ